MERFQWVAIDRIKILPPTSNYFDVTFGNIGFEEIATSVWLSSGG